MFVYNEMMNTVYSRHNDARFQTGAGMLAASFTGSDWGAWSGPGTGRFGPDRPTTTDGFYRKLRRAVADLVSQYRERREAKALGKQLALCNEALLEDIGLTRADVFGLRHGRLTVADIERLRDERNAKTYWTRNTKPMVIDDSDWSQAA